MLNYLFREFNIFFFFKYFYRCFSDISITLSIPYIYHFLSNAIKMIIKHNFGRSAPWDFVLIPKKKNKNRKKKPIYFSFCEYNLDLDI